MNAPVATPQKVSVSESAMRRVAEILAGEPEKDALRISVIGGGCSGFSYNYELVSGGVEDGDIVFEADGARVIVDSVSLPYLEGSVVDFVDDLMGQSFQVRNPNAVASCGCGTSFSI
jgi:iron-sulfur cluster assembly accessory protein